MSASPARAFAAPTITSEHTVDGSIDATGATDVTAALNAWVAAQPNGSRLIFPNGAKYRLGTEGLQLGNRSDLELVGDGCTLDVTAGYAQLASNITLGHVYGGGWSSPCARLQIHGFSLINHNPTPGVYSAAREQASAIAVQEGSSAIQIWDIEAAGIGGDFLTVGGPSYDVWMHDSHSTDVGRQGLTVVCGSWVKMDYCTVDAWGYYCVDYEANTAGEYCIDCYFDHNTFGVGGADQGQGHGFCAAAAATFLELTRLHVTHNTLTGTNADSTLQSYINQNIPKRISEFEFSYNTSARAGGTAQFKEVDGLTVIGNTAAGSALTLDIIDCTDVVLAVPPPAAPSKLVGVWSERYDPAAGGKWRDCTQASYMMVLLHGGAHIPRVNSWQERERFEDHEGLPEFKPGAPAGTVQETGLLDYRPCDVASKALYGVVARPLAFADLAAALRTPGLAICLSGMSGGLPSGYQGAHSVCFRTRDDGRLDVFDPLAVNGAAPTQADPTVIWRWHSALRNDRRVLALNELASPPYQLRTANVYTPIEPTRILDTRIDLGLVDAFYSRTARKLQVTGGVIPAGAVAIAANLTVTQPTCSGYIAAGPAPIDEPDTSIQNFIAGWTVAAQPIIPLAADGSIGITFAGRTANDTAEVILDVTGYFTEGAIA